MAKHTAIVDWNLGDADFASGKFSRVHKIAFDGGAVVEGSPAPAVVPAPMSSESAVDPEEMFVASLSTCHMLWFLHFIHRAGIAITAYHDEVEGTLGRGENKAYMMTDVTLNPVITLAEGASISPEQLKELHDKAHHACYIANSVSTKVVVNPSVA